MENKKRENKLTVGITLYKESIKDLEFSLDNIKDLNNIEILLHVDNNKELSNLIRQDLPFFEIIESDTNVGLGVSRNNLINNCSTEWITFLDCKDQLNDDTLSTEINKLDSSIDAYFYQVNIIENKEQRLKESNFSQSKYKLLWLNSIFKFGNNATAKIYKVDFLQNNEVYFDYKNLYHEDLIFTPKLLSKIKKFRIKNIPIYTWHIEKNSLSTTMNTKKLKDLEYIFNKRRQFYKSLEDSYYLQYAKKSEWQFVLWHIWKSKKLYYLFQAFYIFKTKNKVS